MAKHIAVGTPTQVAHPLKAALRTAVAYLLAAAAFLPLAIPIITDNLGQYLPESWKAWLIASVAFLVALATTITRLMALAQAQGLLAKIGLGTGVEKEPPSPLLEGSIPGELAEYPIADPHGPTSTVVDRYEADITPE